MDGIEAGASGSTGAGESGLNEGLSATAAGSSSSDSAHASPLAGRITKTQDPESKIFRFDLNSTGQHITTTPGLESAVDHLTKSDTFIRTACYFRLNPDPF